MLPDVDPEILANFLAKVSHGTKELAVTDPSLEYLDLGPMPIVKTEVLLTEVRFM
jgi:hypothetical protein